MSITAGKDIELEERPIGLVESAGVLCWCPCLLGLMDNSSERRLCS